MEQIAARGSEMSIGGKGTRIFIITVIVAVIVVAMVVAFVLQSENDQPVDALEHVMSSYNEKDAEGVVESSIFHFAPLQEHSEAVTINQQALDHYGYVVSDINVTQCRHIDDLNQTTSNEVLDYVNHVLTNDYSFLSIVIDDYCVISFTSVVTNPDIQSSVTQDSQFLFVQVGGHWYLFGEGLSIPHSKEVAAW
jgi:hypothetical protein